MLKTNKQNFIDKLKTFNGYGMASIVTTTKVKVTKKSRITGEKTPINLSDITKITYKVVSIGNNYQKSVNNRLNKEKKEQSFVAKRSYTKKINEVLGQHVKSDQIYLRVYPNLSANKVVHTRFIDKFGVDITDRIQDIRGHFLPIITKNKSQGLNNDVIVNNIKIENLKYFKHGDIEFNELDIETLNKLRG